MVDCCLPSRCLRYGHRCLPPPLPPLAVDTIATVAAAANRHPLLLLPQPHDVHNITFKVIFEHLCCHFLVICCLPSRCLHYGNRCLPPPLPLLSADTIATGAAAANCCPMPPAPSATAALLPLLPLSSSSMPSPSPLSLPPSSCCRRRRPCVYACCYHC